MSPVRLSWPVLPLLPCKACLPVLTYFLFMLSCHVLASFLSCSRMAVASSTLGPLSISTAVSTIIALFTTFFASPAVIALPQAFASSATAAPSIRGAFRPLSPLHPRGRSYRCPAAFSSQHKTFTAPIRACACPTTACFCVLNRPPVRAPAFPGSLTESDRPPDPEVGLRGTPTSGPLGQDTISPGDRWAVQRLCVNGEEPRGRCFLPQYLLLARIVLLTPLGGFFGFSVGFKG